MLLELMGSKVHQEKIQAIQDWPLLRNVLDLRRFLGLCSFYRRFVKGFSQLVAPFTDLGKRGAFKWSKDAKVIFDKVK